MNKKILFLIIVAILFFSAASYSYFSKPKTNNTGSHDSQLDNTALNAEEQFDQVPSLVFSDYDGNEINLADFKGLPLIVNAWASWCPFCVNELPNFAKVQNELGEQVKFIAINRSESLKRAKGFSDKTKTTEDLIYLLDSKDSFYRAIGGFSMPETIFVDKNGNIIEHKRGPMDEDEIRDKTQKLLSL